MCIRDRYKILVIGESSVGKTSLINRFANNRYEGIYKPTIVCEFESTERIVEHETMHIQLWDIGGQEHFGGISKIFCRDAVGCAIVCDLSRPATLKSAARWNEEVHASGFFPDKAALPTILLCNKLDLLWGAPKDLRFLSQEELEAFTTQHGFICYSRVSAKTGEYVQESFEILLKEILHKKVLSRSKKEGIQLVSLKQEKRGGCCS
eukprot:TRINITY_DN2691_c0_g1_i3.p2 TRINITY_DN2691_c0_g1~~TRINITY_DN2691_c0_g1_i3.p2  ORF type:complete len:207 (+),score=33.80 TRINITY_DN2691_c0_g1_i3:181-801(+)